MPGRRGGEGDGVLVAGVADAAVADAATQGAGCSLKWLRALGARAPHCVQ